MISAFVLIAAVALSSSEPRASLPTYMGMRLGMASSDALRVFAGKLDEVRPISTPCVRDYLAEHRKVVPMSGRGRCVESMQISTTHGNLLVHFAEDLPKHPGVSIVTEIAFNGPVSSADVGTLVRVAGPPTCTDDMKPWARAVWQSGSCHSPDTAIETPRSGPTMFVDRASGLVISDNRRYQDSQLAAGKILSSRGVRAVP